MDTMDRSSSEEIQINVAPDPPLVSLAWLCLEFSSHWCLGALASCSKALLEESSKSELWARLVFRRWRLPPRASPRIYGGSTWAMVHRNLVHLQKCPRLRSVNGHTIFARGRASGNSRVGSVCCDCWCVVGHRANCRPLRHVAAGVQADQMRLSEAANLIELRVVVQHTGTEGTLVVFPDSASLVIRTLRLQHEVAQQQIFDATTVTDRRVDDSDPDPEGVSTVAVSEERRTRRRRSASSGRGIIVREQLRVVKGDHMSRAPRLVSINDVKKSDSERGSRSESMGSDESSSDGGSAPLSPPTDRNGAGTNEQSYVCHMKEERHDRGEAKTELNGIASSPSSFKLSPLDVGVFSIHVECPSDFLFEPDLLTRADHLTVRMARAVPLSIKRGRWKTSQQHLSQNMLEEEKHASLDTSFPMEIARSLGSKETTSEEVVRLNFVDEGVVWDNYDQLPGGFMVLREQRNFE